MQSLDFRELGLTTFARDQKACGSCYAFVYAVASQILILRSMDINYRNMYFANITDSLQLSIDYLMLKSNNSGCKGGHVIFIQDAVISGRIQTMETEDNFPYKNIFYSAKRLGGTKFQLHSQVIPVSPTETIYLKKADEAITYLNKHIPIFMELQMVQSTMPLSSLYRTHNLIEGPCEKAKESHVVLVVGYGKFKGQDVWVILNSWGRHYGSQGYAYIKRGSNALCGENVMYYLKPKQHDEPIYTSYPHLKNNFQIKRGVDGLDFDNGTYYGYKIHEQLVGDLFLLGQSLLIVVCFASFKCTRRAAYHRNKHKRRINWLSVVE